LSLVCDSPLWIVQKLEKSECFSFAIFIKIKDNESIKNFLSIFLLINYSIYYFWQIINKMKDFFSLIEYLFVEILFAPLDFLRSVELKSWILANGINFVFITIIASLLVYWMIQLVGFDKSGEEDKDPSAHSFL
jgi:hypothetical protein